MTRQLPPLPPRVWLLTSSLAVLLAASCIRAPQAQTSSAANAPAPAGVPDAPPLREDAARAGRKVGIALMSDQLYDKNFARLAARHFDSLTPENEMKWESVEPREGAYNFGPGDKLVAFASQNGMRVRGHTLVWHQQLGSWVKSRSGEALRAAMVAHVRGVAGHWKGQIGEWDVVNEALNDKGELREDSPFTPLGPSFLEDAFRAAHEADPAALLFYNDYEIEGSSSPKSQGAYELVKRLKESGVPIHGVGLQMHVDPRHWPPAADIRANIERLAALGLLVEFTEMDVPVGEMQGTGDEKLAQQRVLTHDIVAACVAVPKCSGITFWGLTDRHSWLNDAHWGQLRGRLPHRPLPFDADYRAKPMLGGIAEALAGK